MAAMLVFQTKESKILLNWNTNMAVTTSCANALFRSVSIIQLTNLAYQNMKRVPFTVKKLTQLVTSPICIISINFITYRGSFLYTPQTITTFWYSNGMKTITAFWYFNGTKLVQERCDFRAHLTIFHRPGWWDSFRASRSLLSISFSLGEGNQCQGET
jgi:hypothetical protein